MSSSETSSESSDSSDLSEYDELEERFIEQNRHTDDIINELLINMPEIFTIYRPHTARRRYCDREREIGEKRLMQDYFNDSTTYDASTFRNRFRMRRPLFLRIVFSIDLLFFGTPGSCNDINVLNRSPLFDDVLSGRAPNVNYSVNGRDYNMAYYLTDGIYPSWAAFVKSITSPQLQKHKLFAQQQEAVRKDVERAFGVLQARFAFLRHPCLVWDRNMMGNIMVACIIIHNMIVEDERDTYLRYYDPSEFLDSSTEDEHVEFSMERVADLSRYMTNRAQLRNREAHIALQNDLIEQVWQNRSDDE